MPQVRGRLDDDVLVANGADTTWVYVGGHDDIDGAAGTDTAVSNIGIPAANDS